MDATLIVALLTALYAVAGAAMLILCWSARAIIRSPETTPHMRAVFELMPSYVAGFRGAGYASALVLYGLAAALVLGGQADAILLFSLAFTLDLALFLTWPPQRRAAYLELLTPAMRWTEAALVLALVGLLVWMLVLREAGQLV